MPGWWLNGRLLRRRKFSRVQLKLLDTAMPLLRRLDRLWPWKGLSLIAVGVKRALIRRYAVRTDSTGSTRRSRLREAMRARNARAERRKVPPTTIPFS